MLVYGTVHVPCSFCFNSSQREHTVPPGLLYTQLNGINELRDLNTRRLWWRPTSPPPPVPISTNNERTSVCIYFATHYTPWLHNVLQFSYFHINHYQYTHVHPQEPFVRIFWTVSLISFSFSNIVYLKISFEMFDVLNICEWHIDIFLINLSTNSYYKMLKFILKEFLQTGKKLRLLCQINDIIFSYKKQQGFCILKKIYSKEKHTYISYNVYIYISKRLFPPVTRVKKRKRNSL